MSLETFRNALDMCTDYMVLGGGEPTIHPLFERFLLEAMAHPNIDTDGVCVITNGLMTQRALMIANLTKKHFVDGWVSFDQYHDTGRVKPEVYKAFAGRLRISSLMPAGRAVTVLGEEFTDECTCEDYIVKPNGDIMQCGCDDTPRVGNVNSGEFDSPDFGCCHLIDWNGDEEEKEEEEEWESALARA